MKLNNDCVRDILLTLEEICTYDSSFSYDMDNDKPHLLASYTHDEILYHVNQCRMANLIIDVHFYDGGDSFEIGDLSPSGHQYLANIRSDKIWNKTKKVASEIGVNSLSAMTQISTQIISSIIKSHFGLA